MKLNKDLVNRLVKAMFYNSKFDFSAEILDENCFELEIVRTPVIIITEFEFGYKLKVFLYTKAEDKVKIGDFFYDKNVFDRESNFFETLFFEML